MTKFMKVLGRFEKLPQEVPLDMTPEEFAEAHPEIADRMADVLEKFITDVVALIDEAKKS